KTIVRSNLVKLRLKVKFTFHVKDGNVGVDKIFFQNDSICLVETLLLRISSIISSADFFESNAPNAFLNDDFLLVKSVLTEFVSLDMRSSLLLVLKLSKSST